MPQPAAWAGDPDCGHEVACAYQTHYCTYIRVPQLLSLQSPGAPDDLLLITAHQWYELWFKVLLTDLRALLADDGLTYQRTKLLRRGIELLRLFEQHADLTESVLVRELGLRQKIRTRSRLPLSGQFRQILSLVHRLPPLSPRAPVSPSGASGGERAGEVPRSGGRAVSADERHARREYTARLRAFRVRYQRFCRASLVPAAAPAPSYAEWLRLPELLSLQEGVKAGWAAPGQLPTGFWKPEQISADENMFVVVHQCFEIWFRVILEHIDRAVPALLRGAVPEATDLLRRVLLIQRLLVTQIQIPATMLPADFLRFRDQTQTAAGQLQHTGLSPASGTESYQFREIEIVCGLRDDPVFRNYLAGTDRLPIRLLTPRQRQRLEQPTLPEAFQQAAAQRGLPRLDDLFTPADVPNPHADLARLAEVLVEFDEFFRLWRLGHLSMVEKMIGGRSGTGFLGPEYLMETAGVKLQERNRVFAERQFRPRFFEALWAVRSRLGNA